MGVEVTAPGVFCRGGKLLLQRPAATEAPLHCSHSGHYAVQLGCRGLVRSTSGVTTEGKHCCQGFVKLRLHAPACMPPWQEVRPLPPPFSFTTPPLPASFPQRPVLLRLPHVPHRTAACA